MAKTKPKKPTMNELRHVIDNIIKDMFNINATSQTAMQTLYYYIDYKGDKEGFTEYVKKKSEEIKESNNEKLKDEDSTTTTQDTKDKSM